MDRRMWYVLGFAAIAAICVIAYALNPGAEFGGADGEGEEMIGEIDPDYEPWFSSYFEPAGETESMLFALQAAIGAIFIGYYLGRGSKGANANAGSIEGNAGVRDR
jgi:cobalt/nickel transport protein